MLALSLACAGCTAIHWTDDAGDTHHLGLFAYTLRRTPRGDSLTTTSLGADLRLGGPSPGWALGGRRSHGVAPLRVEVRDPDRLGDAVADYLALPPAMAEPGPDVEWGILYLVEPVTGRTALLEESDLGMSVLAGETGGLTLGYRQRTRPLGEALADGRVFLRTTRRAGMPVEEAMLWALPPENGAPGRRGEEE